MKIILIFFIVITSTSSYAEKNWGIGASFLHMQMAYKETGLMSEKGALRGVSVDGFWDPINQLSLQFQSRFVTGNLEYQGSTFDGDPLSQTTRDKVTEYRLLTSYKIKDLSPYLGFGYRYWYNDLVISYRRETTYNYLPIGIRYQYRPFYIGAEQRIFLGGLNKSFMGDVGGGRHHIEMKQNTGKGYAIESGAIVKVSEFDVKFSLAYEYWEIEDSETASDGVDTLVEPHNSTNTWAFSLGIYY